MGFLEQVGGSFLTAQQVIAGDTRLTVEEFGLEGFPDGNKVVLKGVTQAGRKTALVLSARNGNFLRSFVKAKCEGHEENLKGATLTLGTVQVMFRGETRDSITITGISLQRKVAPHK